MAMAPIEYMFPRAQGSSDPPKMTEALSVMLTPENCGVNDSEK
jgi:hypothetical protein